MTTTKNRKPLTHPTPTTMKLTEFTLHSVAALLDGTDYRLILMGRPPTPYILQVRGNSGHWEKVAGYTCAEDVLRCPCLASNLRDAAQCASGVRSEKLRKIASAIDANSNAQEAEKEVA